MQLNPAEISELIKSRIEGLSASADIRNQGTVVSVADGICRIHGLSDVMAGEMLEFPPTADGTPTFGLALNLERDSGGSVGLGGRAGHGGEHARESASRAPEDGAGVHPARGAAPKGGGAHPANAGVEPLEREISERVARLSKLATVESSSLGCWA